MTSRRATWSCVLSLWLCAAGRAHAGPWTKAPGDAYLKLGQSVFVADGFRDSNGAFNADTSYVGTSTAFYGEIGLPGRLQAQLYLPFVVGINQFDEDSALRRDTPCDNGRRAELTLRRSFGDAVAGAQWTSPWLPLPHAARALVKLPLYDVGEPDGRCAVLFPQPGDGQLDVDLWLSAGDSFGEGDYFAYLELGHRMRSELYLGTDSGQRFGDTFLAAFQLGWQFSPRAFAMLNLGLALPYVRDVATKGWFNLGPALALPLGAGLSFELSLELTPWARNAGAGRASSLYWTGGMLGVSYKP